MRLKNYSGTEFSVAVDRQVRLMTKAEIASDIGGALPSGVHAVAFESVNRLTNTGPSSLSRKSGLLSVWILGQFNAAPATTVVLPYKQGAEEKMGKIVNDAYFGKVPSDRLKTDEDANAVFFKADGKHRSKIGMNARRTTGNYGSYDPQGHVLTVIQFSSSRQSPDFVNSMWEIQKEPYGGDEINSYNDGPTAGGKQFGPFYEIESSSPAVALAPGGSIQHMHRTIYLQGSPDELDPISMKLFGVHLEQIGNALP